MRGRRKKRPLVLNASLSCVSGAVRCSLALCLLEIIAFTYAGCFGYVWFLHIMLLSIINTEPTTHTLYMHCPLDSFRLCYTSITVILLIGVDQCLRQQLLPLDIMTRDFPRMTNAVICKTSSLLSKVIQCLTHRIIMCSVAPWPYHPHIN